jgi:hypothetical protein
MCDKVQLRKEDCETSLFHHGLIKLLILDSLQKIGRDWNSFIFMAGFQSKTGLTPQPAREFTIAELQREVRAKKQTKPQLPKPVKPLIIQEQPQQSTKQKTQGKKTVPEASKSEAAITSQGDYVAAMKSQIEAAEEEINQLKKAARDLKAQLRKLPTK